MDDTAFSDDFCRFLHALIPNVSAAELLLELRARGELGVQPRSQPERVILDGFVRSGVATVFTGGFAYRLSNEVEAHVDTLAQAYRERPVTLFRIIYALRDGKVQSFADAFRLRKE
jgi:hypothetical protein